MNAVIGQKLEDFFSQYKHQRYKKGEILIRADEEPGGIFYLKAGTVKEYTISKKGEELVVNIFKPGAFFPMSWAINNSTNFYYYEALSELEVWRCKKEDAIDYMKSNNDVLYDLLSRVYKGLDGMLLRMVYLMSENAQDRLMTELIIQAKRFGENQKDGSVAVKVTEKDLASQTGMTRETVSRVIKLLKDRGLVSLQKGVLTVHNISSLESELEGTY